MSYVVTTGEVARGQAEGQRAHQGGPSFHRVRVKEHGKKDCDREM